VAPESQGPCTMSTQSESRNDACGDDEVRLNDTIRFVERTIANGVDGCLAMAWSSCGVDVRLPRRGTLLSQRIPWTAVREPL
jgi:hypothetical protein